MPLPRLKPCEAGALPPTLVQANAVVHMAIASPMPGKAANELFAQLPTVEAAELRVLSIAHVRLSKIGMLNLS